MSDTFTVSNGYIELPVTTDPSTIQQEAILAIAGELPGWVPQESHIEVLLLEQFAAMTAESAQVATQVPLAIFSYFGSLVGINPLQGAQATALSTWTMVDNAGYTVPAGTVVGYQVLGNQLSLFQTTASFTVPSGSTTATGITIQAQSVGSAFNNLPTTPNLVPITALNYLSSVVATTISSGGADPETTTAYLDRLSTELQLLTPRPILPSDFATLAPSAPGAESVVRATAYTGRTPTLLPGRNITNCTLVNGQPSIACSTANFTVNDIGRTVTDTTNSGYIPGGTTILSVQSTTAATMTANATHAATTDTLDLHAFVAGAAITEERVVTVAVADASGGDPGLTARNDVSSYLASLREVNFIVPVLPPTPITIDVTWVAQSVPGSNTGTVTTTGDALLSTWLSSANWGTVIGSEGQVEDFVDDGGNPAPVWDPTATVVRYLQTISVLDDTPGILYIVSVQIGSPTLSIPLGTSDIDLTGGGTIDAPLTTVGTISGTVT